MSGLTPEPRFVSIYKLAFCKKRTNWSHSRSEDISKPSETEITNFNNYTPHKTVNPRSSQDKALLKRKSDEHIKYQSKLKPPTNYKKSPYRSSFTITKQDDRWKKSQLIKPKLNRNIKSMEFSQRENVKSDTNINLNNTYELDQIPTFECAVQSLDTDETFLKPYELKDEDINVSFQKLSIIESYDASEELLASSLIVNELEDNSVCEESFMEKATLTVHSSEMDLINIEPRDQLALYEGHPQDFFSADDLHCMSYEDLRNNILVEEMQMMRHYTQKQIYEKALYKKMAIDDDRMTAAFTRSSQSLNPSPTFVRGRGYRGRGRAFFET